MIGLDLLQMPPSSPMREPESAHRAMIEAVRDLFDANPDAETPRVFHLIWPEHDSVAVIDGHWSDDAGRCAKLAWLRHMIARTQPSHYAVFSEVWHVSRRGLPQPGQPMPSECDDRKEALIFLTVPRIGAPLFSLFPILRRNGRREIGPVDTSDIAREFSGDLTGLYQ